MKLKTINDQYKIIVTTIATLFLGGLVYGLVAPNVSEAQAEVATVVGPGGYSLTINSSTGNLVEMDVTPSTTGNLKMGEEILTTSTTATSGYQLYIGMNSNNNSLYLNGDTSSTALAAIANTATYTSPTNLGANAWGYAIPQTYTDKSTGSTGTQIPGTDVATGNGFNAGTYIDGGDNTDTKWAAVPAQGSEQLLQSTDSATTDKSLHIFYGAKVNNVQSAGIYKGTVVYTAVAAAAEQSMVSVSPGVLTSLDGGDTLTIDLGVNTTYTAAFLTNSTITIGTESCTPTGGGNASGELYLTCTAPAQSLSGRYDVTVNLSDGSNNYGTYTAVNGIEYKTDGGGAGGGGAMTVSPNVVATTVSTPITFTLPLYVTYNDNFPDDSPSSVTSPSVTIDGQTCTSPTMVSSGTLYQITCNSPAISTVGTYDVSATVTTDGDTRSYTIEDGIEYIFNPLLQLTSMQDSNLATACANTPEGFTRSNLVDSRDNQEYTIFKAKDGNCWMGENLRYGSTTANGARAYQSSDASLSNNMNTTNMANLTTSRICTKNSSCKTPGNVNMFYSSGDNYTMPYIMIYDANTVATYDGKTKYGVLYNYCAATGGTVCDTAAMSADATGSVCPSGWKLPGMTASATGSGATTDGTVKTYNNLANSYGYGNTSAGLTGMTSSPLNFVRTGIAYNGSLTNRSSSGYGDYWVSTKYTGTNYAYLLLLYASNGNYVIQSYYSRYGGLSVRCVAS